MKRILFAFAAFLWLSVPASAAYFDTSLLHYTRAAGETSPEAELQAIRDAQKFFSQWEIEAGKLQTAKQDLAKAFQSENFAGIESNLSLINSVFQNSIFTMKDKNLYLSSNAALVEMGADRLSYCLSPKNVFEQLKVAGLDATGNSFKEIFSNGLKIENRDIAQKYLYAFNNIFDTAFSIFIESTQKAGTLIGAKTFDTIAFNRVEEAQKQEQGKAEKENRNKNFFGGFFDRALYGLKELLPSLIFCTLLIQFLARFSRLKNPDLAGPSGMFTFLVSAAVFYVLYLFLIVGPWTLRIAPILIAVGLFALPAGFRYRFIHMFTGNSRFASAFNFGESEDTTDDIGEGTHGSADWASSDDMKKKGRLSPQEPGFALGRDADSLARFWFLGHVLTCAPTGSGKGIGAVIPNLLDYPGSAFVIDLKGENYAVTARQRRALGHNVVKVDPFTVIKEDSARFNPLDIIDLRSEDCISVSGTLAGLVVMQEKAGEMGHWDESALNLIQGLILHVKTLQPEQQTFTEVRKILTSSVEEFQETLAEMCISNDAFGVIARSANALVSKPEKERGSIVSTAQRHTQFLDDPRVSACLCASDFDITKIKETFLSVFVILPPAKLSQNARLVRLLLGCSLFGLTSTEKKPRYRVAFMLDEFAQLGYMEQIESSISLLRGYGACFWIFIQDLSQLKGIYKKWQSFLANAAKQFFGTSDFDTAEYISKSLGTKTITQTSFSEGGNLLSKLKGQASKSESTSETGRALLTPDEVMRLGPETPIVLIAGERPYALRRLNYLEDTEYRGLFDQNPYHA